MLILGKGVLGKLYNKATRARFNNDIWGDNGRQEKDLQCLVIYKI